MLNLISWSADLLQNVAPPDLAHLLTPAAGPIVPTPGNEVPPGFEKFERLLGYAMWGAFFCAVAGFILIGARMAINHKRGEGSSHMASLAIAGAGVVVIGSAVALVKGIINP